MAGIYIHIPFCKQRCYYCSFFSSTYKEKKEQYITTLCDELKRRNNYIKDTNIKTIYIGGGTPSLLNEKHFEKIFHTINNHYSVTKNCEITLEANPDDLSYNYLSMLRQFPFNRLSIGIQSFDDTLLKSLGRRHDSKRAIEAFNNARTVGFENISIDLMYALPNSTQTSWQNDIKTTLSLNPEHISAYNLTYEEGTPLHQAIKKGKIQPVSEEENINQFTTLIDTLASSGYQHYEISNFSLPGYKSIHNSNYWNNTPYIGCGAAAHSYNGTSRQWNIANIDLYIKNIVKNTPLFEIETLTENERYNDAILTRLRTSEGLPLEWFKKEFSEKHNKYMLNILNKHISYGTLIKIENNHIRLTRKGLFISDSIIRDLIYI